jgi:leucyl aminopeptidase
MHVLATADRSLPALWDEAMRLGRAGERATFDLTRLPQAEQGPAAGAVAEAASLGAYRFRAPQPAAAPVEIRASVPLDVPLRRAEIVAAATNLARALVDAPPSALTPAALAERARELASEHGWSARIRDLAALRTDGFGAIAAVGAGSDRPPFLIELEHRGRAGDGVDLCLAGKGITMDCGGLNLKTDRLQAAVMKSDMAGGAAVLATLVAATRLRLPLNVRVLIAAAENMPGPLAIRPGDVVTHPCGRTTEVVNTDAEGRLVLADCLTYSAADPDVAAIVDVGTLSDAPFAPAGWLAVSNDDALGVALVLAGVRVGELGVHAPLRGAYRRVVPSAVADAANFDYGRQESDVMLAPAYLSAFVGDKAWAHIDPSESVLLARPWGAWGTGATGVPTRSLIALLEKWPAPEATT